MIGFMLRGANALPDPPNEDEKNLLPALRCATLATFYVARWVLCFLIEFYLIIKDLALCDKILHDESREENTRLR